MAKTGWSTPPEDYSEVVVKTHKQLVQKASIHLLRGVVLRSPVDTGRFRANWQITEGSVFQGVIQDFNAGEDGSSGAAVASGAIRKGINTVLGSPKEFPTYYLTNNLPYAIRLENGWSDQAPNGMVALSLLDTLKWLEKQ